MALTGFRHMTVVDLDTIDVTNLNRQFLFQKPHVGQSKALVAAAAVRRFNPLVDIVAEHGSITRCAAGARARAAAKVADPAPAQCREGRRVLCAV